MFRFLVLRDGPKAKEAKALLGRSFRQMWKTKAATDGYDPSVDDDSPRARFTRTMQRFVDRFEEIPVVVLACFVRYRAANPYEGASVYPAVQNLLLAARDIGLGGVITMWHAAVEDELRRVLDIPDEVAISATIPLGHPEGNHGPVRRRPMREIVYDDEWERAAPWAREPS
jgi:nitroreductase